MTEAIGIRLDEETLRKVDSLSEEEESDRSTIIRKLISKGFKEITKEKAAEKYIQGRITLSEAGRRANLSLWDLQSYLVGRGFKSQYSVEDLMEEAAMLAKKK